MKYLIAIGLILFTGCKDDPKKSIDPPPKPVVDMKLVSVKNETLGLKIKYAHEKCEPAVSTSGPIKLVHYDIGEIQVNKPSYEGSPNVPGKFQDPLHVATQVCPGKEYWLDVEVDKQVGAGEYTLDLYKQKIGLTVKNWIMPDVASLPLYVQMAPWDIAKAHGDNNQTRLELYPPYFQALLDHRIYPYRQNVSSAINPWMTEAAKWAPAHMFLPLSTYSNPSDQKIKDLAAWVKTTGKPGVVYVHDEPAESEMAKVIAHAKKLKALAPDLELMVTTKHRQDLVDAGISIFTEVLHPGFLTGKARWAYTSCMVKWLWPECWKRFWRT